MSDLPAGRELNALVAERVMGWVWLHDGFGNHRWYADNIPVKGYGPRQWGGYREFQPSVDIAAAWVVVEKLEHLNPVISRCNLGAGFWQVIFEGPEGSTYAEYDASAPTAPHAICLAALAACHDPTHEPKPAGHEGDGAPADAAEKR